MLIYYHNKKLLFNLLWILFVFMANSFVHAQNATLQDAILLKIRNQDYTVADALISKETISEEDKKQLRLFNTIKKEFGVYKTQSIVREIPIEPNNSEYAIALNYLNLGLYQLLYKYDNESGALKNLNVALKHAEKINNHPLKCEIYKAIFIYYSNIVYFEDKLYLVYLNEYHQNLYDDFEQANYKAIKLTLALFSNAKEIPTEDIEALKKLSVSLSDDFLKGAINKSLGLFYDIKQKNYKLASDYYKKAQFNFSKRTNGESIIGERSSQICNGVTEYYLKKYDDAIANLQKIDTCYNGKNYCYNKLFKYFWLSYCYRKTNACDSAYIYLEKEKELKDKLNQSKHDAINSELSVKYQTLILKTKNEREMLWIYLFISLLIVGSIVAYLKVTNLRKKEQIAIQEKELQNERFEKALKDHELESIESMLEGQEKERIKIANDLHDNLGSMLVTLKLNFQNLKERRDTLKTEEDKLYQKTDALLEEAYQKVRTISHTKNAGVIASDGLLPAIKNIANKVSVPGILQVDVVAFGLENRLENTLEVSIFRMIQELMTNIIKHSDANKATIHLTQHDDSLNIIIEDNGKGFDSSIINSEKGMGLSNIKKKVEHMNGTFEIDSLKDKGTTIIIDIPI